MVDEWVSLLIAIDSLSRAIAHPVWRSLATALLMLPIIALLASGQLDQLSLMKEYVNRRDVFDDALWRHIQILLTTLVPAVVIGIPLVYFVFTLTAYKALFFDAKHYSNDPIYCPIWFTDCTIGRVGCGYPLAC